MNADAAMLTTGSFKPLTESGIVGGIVIGPAGAVT
jgi:hypothetical protein